MSQAPAAWTISMLLHQRIRSGRLTIQNVAVAFEQKARMVTWRLTWRKPVRRTSGDRRLGDGDPGLNKAPGRLSLSLIGDLWQPRTVDGQ